MHRLGKLCRGYQDEAFLGVQVIADDFPAYMFKVIRRLVDDGILFSFRKSAASRTFVCSPFDSVSNGGAVPLRRAQGGSAPGQAPIADGAADGFRGFKGVYVPSGTSNGK
jgi:hypothetical protein